ncbi:hypothetical protein GGR56DRAFT_690889 [Xylariaceae sp. FL0804]|nr:hypothetical protein GGR56DRAFT_690889 [Xylariaceae sp. FL0804]
MSFNGFSAPDGLKKSFDLNALVPQGNAVDEAVEQAAAQATSVDHGAQELAKREPDIGPSFSNGTSVPQDIVYLKLHGQAFSVHKKLIEDHSPFLAEASSQTDNWELPIIGDLANIDVDTLGDFVDALYNSQPNWGEPRLLRAGENRLSILTSLPKLHRLCKLVHTGLLAGTVRREFIRFLSELTLEWKEEGKLAENTMAMLGRSFNEWAQPDAESVQSLIVTKLCKTCPEQVCLRLASTLDREFSIAILKEYATLSYRRMEEIELKHTRAALQVSLFGQSQVKTTWGSDQLKQNRSVSQPQAAQPKSATGTPQLIPQKDPFSRQPAQSNPFDRSPEQKIRFTDPRPPKKRRREI